MLRHAGEVPHAKAVVQNAEQVFVTFADLTPKALDQKIGARVLISDRPLAQVLGSHPHFLSKRGLIMPLPPGPLAVGTNYVVDR